MSKRQKALAAIIACVFFWGFSFISIKVTVAIFPPMSLGLLRFALALVFLYFIKLKQAPNEKLRLKDVPLLFGAGFTGVTLYFFCENNGVSLVTASEASIAIGSIPVLTMIADWLGEKIIRHKRIRMAHNEETSVPSRIRARQWLGSLISITGVWLVAGVSLALSGSALGYIYMAGAAFSWVAYSFLTRPLFARCSRIHIVFWQTAAGFICFIPFSIFELRQWGSPNVPVLIHLVFLGICCSALGYWFYAHALEVLGVSICATFINLIPVITVIAGFFIMGDRLSPLQWLGAALVVSGVYLAMWEGKLKPVKIKFLHGI
ncbi:membrane protein [Spirochaetia bacterium]|nr:membrane protein [Spirochaetia bacterium]